MNALRINGPRPAARNLIDDAIAENGASRVLMAAMVAMLRNWPARRSRPPDAHEIGRHLQRDVGFHVEPEAADWCTLMR